MNHRHVPVMMEQVLSYLDPQPGKIIADGTLGGSGHAKRIMENLLPDGLLIGLDKDIRSIANAKTVLGPYLSRVRLFRESFDNLPDVLLQLNITAVDGILLDLGLSSDQLESGNRGFSFQSDEPLDMRMDVREEQTAADLVNTLSESELAGILRKYGEEPLAKKISRRIVSERNRQPIQTSRELARIVEKVKHKPGKSRIHPATQVFMALRIAVNKELETLKSFMTKAPGILKKGGRLCILSFHSLEDRIVKQEMKQQEKSCICPAGFPVCTCNKKPLIKILTRKVVRPTEDEIRENPRSRSTKLRAAEKI